LKARDRAIEVWGDWAELVGMARIGVVHATPARGKEIFAVDYGSAWIVHLQRVNLDPNLALNQGRQYGPHDRTGFGVFLDSAPDRWGHLLINRREALAARVEQPERRSLFEPNYLLGVYDGDRLVDDHLRNDGFLLVVNGWTLAPALGMNPVEMGGGVTLNVSDADSSLNLDLARSVARRFQIKVRAAQIIKQVTDAVRQWRQVASAMGIPEAEQQRVRSAFRVAEASPPQMR
jgi:hypothetical protein